MNKRNENLDEKELLNRIESLIDSENESQEYKDSFLGFCSRLFNIRPKADESFQSTLKQELLNKHAVQIEKRIEPRRNMRDYYHAIVNAIMPKTTGMRTMKVRIAYAAIVSLVLVLALVFTIAMPSSQGREAYALEIMANDPLWRTVLQEYDIRVQEVEVENGIAYVFLEKDSETEIIVSVDLQQGIMGKIVIETGDLVYEYDKMHELFDDAFELRNKWEIKDMTLEELKEYLIHQKDSLNRLFEGKAEANGMTPEKLKVYLIEKFEAKAETEGMTIDEYIGTLVQ